MLNVPIPIDDESFNSYIIRLSSSSLPSGPCAECGRQSESPQTRLLIATGFFVRLDMYPRSIDKSYLRETKRYRAKKSILEIIMDVSGTTTLTGKKIVNTAFGIALQDCGAGVIFNS